MWTHLSFLSVWLLMWDWVALSSGVVKVSRRDVHGMLGAPPPTNDPLPPDHWFTQLLDHFEPTTSTIWQQVRLTYGTTQFIVQGTA